MSALADEIRAAVREELRPLLGRLDALRPAGLDPLAGLDITEAARVAHRSPDTLRRAIREGKLKATRPDGGRQWIVLAGDLEQWMGRRKTQQRVDIEAAGRQALARAVGGRR